MRSLPQSYEFDHAFLGHHVPQMGYVDYTAGFEQVINGTTSDIELNATVEELYETGKFTQQFQEKFPGLKFVMDNKVLLASGAAAIIAFYWLMNKTRAGRYS